MNLGFANYTGTSGKIVINDADNLLTYTCLIGGNSNDYNLTINFDYVIKNASISIETGGSPSLGALNNVATIPAQELKTGTLYAIYSSMNRDDAIISEDASKMNAPMTLQCRIMTPCATFVRIQPITGASFFNAERIVHVECQTSNYSSDKACDNKPGYPCFPSSAKTLLNLSKSNADGAKKPEEPKPATELPDIDTSSFWDSLKHFLLIVALVFAFIVIVLIVFAAIYFLR